MTDKKKKMWALISSGLMIAFMLPQAVSSLNRNKDVTYGYAGRDKITNRQIGEARAQWDLLKRLTIKQTDPRTGQEQEGSFLLAYLARGLGQQGGPMAQQLVSQIDQNAEQFYLLVREAEQMGTAVSNDQV